MQDHHGPTGSLFACDIWCADRLLLVKYRDEPFAKMCIQYPFVATWRCGGGRDRRAAGRSGRPRAPWTRSSAASLPPPFALATPLVCSGIAEAPAPCPIWRRWLHSRSGDARSSWLPVCLFFVTATGEKEVAVGVAHFNYLLRAWFWAMLSGPCIYNSRSQIKIHFRKLV